MSHTTTTGSTSAGHGVIVVEPSSGGDGSEQEQQGGMDDNASQNLFAQVQQQQQQQQLHSHTMTNGETFQVHNNENNNDISLHSHPAMETAQASTNGMERHCCEGPLLPKSWAVLFTKQKTQKRKVWKDGRLVVSSGTAVLYDAHPLIGSTAATSAMDQCELSHAEFNRLAPGTLLEMEQHLVTLEGPWIAAPSLPPTVQQQQQQVRLLPTTTTIASNAASSSTSALAVSTGMKKLLSNKFKKPGSVVPPPPSLQQQQQYAFLGKRKRPLQPGELQQQYYGHAVPTMSQQQQQQQQLISEPWHFGPQHLQQQQQRHAYNSLQQSQELPHESSHFTHAVGWDHSTSQAHSAYPPAATLPQEQHVWSNQHQRSVSVSPPGSLESPTPTTACFGTSTLVSFRQAHTERRFLVDHNGDSNDRNNNNNTHCFGGNNSSISSSIQAQGQQQQQQQQPRAQEASLVHRLAHNHCNQQQQLHLQQQAAHAKHGKSTFVPRRGFDQDHFYGEENDEQDNEDDEQEQDDNVDSAPMGFQLPLSLSIPNPPPPFENQGQQRRTIGNNNNSTTHDEPGTNVLGILTGREAQDMTTRGHVPRTESKVVPMNMNAAPQRFDHQSPAGPMQAAAAAAAATTDSAAAATLSTSELLSLFGATTQTDTSPTNESPQTSIHPHVNHDPALTSQTNNAVSETSNPVVENAESNCAEYFTLPETNDSSSSDESEA